jgi:hypothetical protein|uniref:DUF4282 domain-containing protein n=1 Tax=candidate division WOR-3 bacterium TaxID=2052148 RepID=A0A7V3RIW0_UNCW3
MQKKFTALRIVSVIFKVLAWIVAVFTVIGFIVMLIGGAAMSSMMSRGYGYGGYGGMGALGAFGSVGIAFGILIYGALMFVSLLAASDIILVILAIEENTRALKPPQTNA